MSIENSDTAANEFLHVPLVRASMAYLAQPNDASVCRALDQAITETALAGHVDHYEVYKQVSQAWTSQQRVQLESAFEVCADGYRTTMADGRRCQATLMSIPVMLIADHAASHLDGEAFDVLKTSLHRHGLVDESITVVMLPEMVNTLARLASPVQRKRLLIDLVEPLIRGEPAGTVTVDAGLEQPEEFSGAEMTCTMRYLTFALFAAEGDLTSLVNRWLEDDMDELMLAWSLEVGEAIRTHGDYQDVEVGAPSAYGEAETKGLIQQGITAIQVFVAGVTTAAGMPPVQACELALQYVEKGETGPELFLYYRRGGKMLEANKVLLPDCRWAEEMNIVVDTLTQVAVSAAEAAGISACRHIQL